MRARLLEVDSGAWTSFLADVRHDFYHLPAYVALCATQERGEPLALLVSERGQHMLLPIIIRQIAEGGSDAMSPYGYPGPLASGTDHDGFMQAALAKGIRMLESRGIVSLFVRLHPLLNRATFDTVGEVVVGGEVVSIDLTLPPDTLWRQTRPGHRTQISQAIRAGREAIFDDSWSYYSAFKGLYRATMTRVSASPYYFFDDAYFDGLRVALGDRLRLCVAVIDGALAAGALFVETCGLVQFHLSGSNPAFAREGLTKLLIHHVRSWAKDRGDLELHLGGGVGAAEDSLFRFKAGFSPARYPYRTLRVIVNEANYSRLIQSRAPGAVMAPGRGFFPAYRDPAVQPPVPEP